MHVGIVRIFSDKCVLIVAAGATRIFLLLDWPTPLRSFEMPFVVRHVSCGIVWMLQCLLVGPQRGAGVRMCGA